MSSPSPSVPHRATRDSAPLAAAVLVAAGASVRLGGGEPSRVRKPLLEVGGRLLIEHAAEAFRRAETIAEIVVVAHAGDVERLERLAASSPALEKVVAVVAGGAERTDSVRAGVRWCHFDLDVLCIHDAARPLVLPATIDLAVRRAAERGAALVARPVVDTLHRVGDEGAALVTVDRAGLWAAQTPQCFRAREFRRVLARSAEERVTATDDAALWQRYVGAPELVEGDAANFKVTTPADLELLEALVAWRAQRGGIPA